MRRFGETADAVALTPSLRTAVHSTVEIKVAPRRLDPQKHGWPPSNFPEVFMFQVKGQSRSTRHPAVIEQGRGASPEWSLPGRSAIPSRLSGRPRDSNHESNVERSIQLEAATCKMTPYRAQTPLQCWLTAGIGKIRHFPM
jgi:hypothetical protein